MDCKISHNCQTIDSIINTVIGVTECSYTHYVDETFIYESYTKKSEQPKCIINRRFILTIFGNNIYAYDLADDGARITVYESKEPIINIVFLDYYHVVAFTWSDTYSYPVLIKSNGDRTFTTKKGSGTYIYLLNDYNDDFDADYNLRYAEVYQSMDNVFQIYLVDWFLVIIDLNLFTINTINDAKPGVNGYAKQYSIPRLDTDHCRVFSFDGKEICKFGTLVDTEIIFYTGDYVIVIEKDGHLAMYSCSDSKYTKLGKFGVYVYLQGHQGSNVYLCAVERSASGDVYFTLELDCKEKTVKRLPGAVSTSVLHSATELYAKTINSELHLFNIQTEKHWSVIKKNNHGRIAYFIGPKSQYGVKTAQKLISECTGLVKNTITIILDYL